MISLAMTTYNGEKYILEQLNSILNQTMKPDEVIISDDGSTDGTIEIIKEFILSHKLDNTWKLYINEIQKGFIKNFIDTILLTKYDIVFLADQDDVFLENKFEIMVSFMEKNKGCVVLNANYDFVNAQSSNLKNGSRLCSPKRKNGERIDFNHFLYNSNYPGFSMAFKKSICLKLRDIKLENVYGHDNLINLIGLNENGVYEIRDVLSLYRLHNNNTSDVGKTISSYQIENRISQKKKELKEYYQLLKCIDDNKLKNIDTKVVKKRISTLTKRIDILKNKSIIRSIIMILFNNSYPKRTLIGDLIFILKNEG